MKIKLGDKEIEARSLTLLDLRANWKVLTEVNGEPLTSSATVLSLATGLTVDEVLGSFPLRGGVGAMERAAKEVMDANGLEEPGGKAPGEAASP